MFLFKRRSKKTVSTNPTTNTDASTVCAAAASDVGLCRGNNEDNFILYKQSNPDCLNHCEAFAKASTKSWFFIGVFDGMGGGEIGEVAAKTAVITFLEAIERIDHSSSKTQVDCAMRQAFLDANNKVIDLQKHHQVFGTTGTVVGTNGDLIKVYHLGDSRAYLMRDQKLVQLTRDQTLAQMKMDVGIYQPDAPGAEAEKHQLTEYIGKDPTRKYLRPLESDWFSLQSGDGILLCSDGLYDMCSDLQIRDLLLSHSSPSEKVKALTAAALSAGGLDNVTCIYMVQP